MTTSADYLRDHRFKTLFTDLLGWEHAAGDLTLSVKDRTFHIVTIAHKRGLQVLRCGIDPVALVNRALLRKVQKAVARTAHEHILIFCCETPRKQVWQWAIRMPDGGQLRHREHPFFSARPPAPFLERLSGLRFSLDEEENVTLVDALARVRRALDTMADQNLFVRRPWYAERSDELARAMQGGDTASFQRFVLFHLKLARKISKRLCRWFGMAPDDAEQIAILGLLRAALKYRPELGYQFSTYATYWVKQACQRYGPDFALMIRLPVHVFWPCFRLRLSLEERVSATGATGIRMFLVDLGLRDPKLSRNFRDFERATGIQSLSERAHYRAACQIAEPCSNSLEDVEHMEQAERIQQALSQLHVRQAQILRLRYGFDGCPEQTLEEIGKLLSLSRERVRQIQRMAESRLPVILARLNDAENGTPCPQRSVKPAAFREPRRLRPPQPAG